MTEKIDFKKNSLNTFRLIAATQVLGIHALYHLDLKDIPFLGGFIEFFSGVPIFLTLSGFLIWNSIGNSCSFKDYAKKRFWRIYPELWVAVAVEIIVLLLLYRQPIDWPKLGLFAIGQASIFQFWTPDFLRGYGCGCPNGVLWTITVLIQFYFLSYFIYKYLKNKSCLFWCGCIVFFIVIEIFESQIVSMLPSYLGKLYGVSLIPYLWMFLLSAFVAEYREKILPVLKKYWWVFVVVLIIKRLFVPYDLRMNNDYSLFNVILLFLGMIGFAYKLPQLNIKKDISYGVYIYHMTIINALIALGFVGQEWTLMVVVGMSCLLAWLSTMTIGKIAITKKEKLYGNIRRKNN